ncbi:MAG: choice-of-anchor D domain-containing protein, partial [Candidatus Cloacimonadaceae bacterium]|nr:choice-of-anchor D domain-containing protein [Candidatus Cloacimonadaceae bacterium]
MKKCLLFVLLLALALGAISNLDAQVEVTIGDGTTTNTATGAPAPYGTWYKNFRQQLLYRADDFFAAGATPGLITALGFNVQDLDTCTPMTNFRIRLKLTDQEALTTTFEVGDYTTVWQSDPFMPTTGWNLHTLTTPFLWDGTSNLLVEIVTDLVTGAYARNALTYYTATNYNSSLRYQSDSATASTALTGTLAMNRSNIRLLMSPPSPDPVFMVSPPAMDFGDVVLGYTPSQNFNVMNVGGGTLTVNSISISGSPFFSLINLPTLPSELVLGEPTSFSVVYAPTAAGDHTATITITDNLRQTHTVALTGHGVDTTIYELSYAQGFDEVAIPTLPLGWSSIYQATATTGYVKTVTTSPQSAPNCVAIYNPTDINTTAMLIAPPLANTIPVNNVRVKLWGKGNNYSLKVGVMTNPADATTFTEIETLTFTSAWAQYQVSLGSYTGAGKFIAFKHANNAAGQTIYVDTIEFEMMGANDLAAIAILGNTTPSVNIATNYTVSVFNNGTAAQSNYQVQIVDNQDTVLVSAAGQNIAPGETVSATLTYTPTTQGVQTIMGKVVLTGDINPNNNTTQPLQLLVQPEDIVSVTIGEGNLNERVPFEYWYKNSLFQTLYYPDEFGMFGQITGISLYNNFSLAVMDTPIKLWLGTTTTNDLSAGWIDPTTLTLVFDGTMNFPAGENTITIPFIAPFDYFNDNLVLYANRPMDTQYHSSTNYFQAQTVGTNRARRLQNDSTVYDPMNPSATGALSGTFPKATFFMTVDGMGSLSGTVTSAGSPLADVDINITDTTYHTTTSASGQYSFPYLLEGNYTLSAHKIGYEDRSINFSIVEDQTTTVNIVMTPSASVNVTGTIVGSDNPAAGLSDGVINLYGVINYTANTNASGQFVVENVLSGNTFTYAISRAGYQTETGTIIVGSSNYAMGTITLTELTLPPVSVTATLNDAETAVNLTWRAPGQAGSGMNFDFENDDGGWEASSNLAGSDGDWEYSSDYNVANWTNTGDAGANVTPPPTAHSGTGMWGTKMNTNYLNSGGFSYLTKTFNFAGITNAQMRFYSWENVFGDFDYCQVSVNGSLVWGPSWDYTGTIWQERTIDLSAYDGMTEVEIRFEMFATTVVNYAGWYIDDVEIGSADAVVSTSPSPEMPLAMRGLSETEASLLAASFSKTQPRTQSLAQRTTQPSRIPVGYHVYRLMPGQEQQPDLWTQLTTAAITDTAYVAPGWNALVNGLHKWAVKTVYTGGVLSNPAFSNNLRKMPDDLSALSILGNATPTVNEATNYIVRIKNTGTSAQTAGAYNVKIYSGTTELASVTGPAIAVNEEMDITLVWTPATTGTIQIHGKVLLPGDLVPDNDTTDPLTVSVMEEGLLVIGIGTGTATNTNTGAPTPYGTYYKAFRQQFLYTAAEFYAAGGIPGMITALAFNVQDLDTCSPMPNYTIRMKHTDEAALGTTFDTDGYTTVWHSDEFMPTTAWNLHNFSMPFFWNGTSNLIIDISTDMIPGTYTRNARVLYSTTSFNSSLRFQSDSANGSTGSTGTVSMNRSNTRFFMVPAGGDPVFMVNPSLHNFGEVNIGGSRSQNFTIINAGGGTLGINQISIAGSGTFALSNLPTLPAALETAETATFTVNYTPNSLGEDLATVTITDDQDNRHVISSRSG